jgi:hypothetical protein
MNKHDLQRLETVGDSFLELAVSIFHCRKTVETRSVSSIPAALQTENEDLVSSKHLSEFGEKLQPEFFNSLPPLVSLIGEEMRQRISQNTTAKTHRRLRGGDDRRLSRGIRHVCYHEIPRNVRPEHHSDDNGNSPSQVLCFFFYQELIPAPDRMPYSYI